ncbi:MAG: 3'(2'),5'-bisphosphate nucleotidase CysQ [Bacteroidetes bacterium]|nr:3'(2'),5'-bisphosphate nucleotidase CysQ [Bacteroidota bacterium]
MNYTDLLYQAILAAVAGGKEILTVYDTDFSVEYKEDDSPLTLADKKASQKISEMLEHLRIPVLSEEGEHTAFETRRHWKHLWIVDPLDGTKEFVKRNGEFTVNIALVEEGIPKVGVIYSPVLKDIYFAALGLGAFKINKHDFMRIEESVHTLTLDNLVAMAGKLPLAQDHKTYRVVASRSHMSSETYAYIEQLKKQHPEVEIVSTGSSIKMCWVAEGVANEYPRFGPTMEWDTAAGQAILQQAGCELIDYDTKEPMQYNRAELLNHWFIARRKGLL